MSLKPTIVSQSSQARNTEQIRSFQNHEYMWENLDERIKFLKLTDAFTHTNLTEIDLALDLFGVSTSIQRASILG
jgi:hypothetical protein